MQVSEPRHPKYLFVCENERADGSVCCGAAGAGLREALKRAVKERGLQARVRVARAGCLDVCAEGPNVLLMPDGVWFKKVSAADIGPILERL